MTRALPSLTATELLVNLPLGPDVGVAALPAPAPGGVQAALEAVLVRALSRPPCFVSFSGGRDSSAVLALAAAAARRHGLVMPVPATMRFPSSPASDEAEWQEQVLGHLGLDNAQLLDLGDEIEALGPAATLFLARHGSHWPANTHMHAPVMELARGGTVLTGVGGDELFGTRAGRRSWRALLLASLPPPVRAEVVRRRRRPSAAGWLTPAGRALAERALAREEVRWPHPWDRALDYWYASRSFTALDGTLRALGSDFDVEVVNPLLDPQVLSELRREGGAGGFASRTEAMRRLCGHLLPDAVLARSTKAVFDRALWGPATAAFVDAWDGRGVDPRHVDLELVRAELAKPAPDFRVLPLLHLGWLASELGKPL